VDQSGRLVEWMDGGAFPTKKGVEMEGLVEQIQELPLPLHTQQPQKGAEEEMKESRKSDRREKAKREQT